MTSTAGGIVRMRALEVCLDALFSGGNLPNEHRSSSLTAHKREGTSRSMRRRLSAPSGVMSVSPVEIPAFLDRIPISAALY